MEIIGHFQTSLRRALEEIDPAYESYKGLIVCGTHSPENLDIKGALEKIREARETSSPFLGICFGHQLAAIEYARNVMGIQDATSEEFGQTWHAVVIKRPEGLKVGLHNGETYWSHYMVDPELEFKWTKPLSFLTTQSHPEYQSGVGNPHPLLVEFLNLCKNQ